LTRVVRLHLRLEVQFLQSLREELGAMISQVIASLVFEQRGTGDALLLRLI
jgi:hypothetical protein